jgi:mono/diheme cytochrome c family protein
MTDASTDTSRAGSDGLWHWLVGGLLGGAAILGLLVAAYAVGYHRGKHSRPSAAPAPVATTTRPGTTTKTPTSQAQPTGLGPVTATPTLVSRGKQLFASNSCSGCHSLTGAKGAGPPLNGLAGTQVALDNGQTVTADDVYLERSITDPDAEIAKGFQRGIMSGAIASFDLANKPDDVRGLVAYIKSQK